MNDICANEENFEESMIESAEDEMIDDEFNINELLDFGMIANVVNDSIDKCLETQVPESLDDNVTDVPANIDNNEADVPESIDENVDIDEE